jgi:hypothetical protein
MGQSIHKMIVYYENIYGIVDVEELFYLMDMTSQGAVSTEDQTAPERD